MLLVPNSYGARRLREHNDCHSPEDGKFCSKEGSLRYYGRPEKSARIPEYLRDDVKRAARAGIGTFHHQQPEPVQDVTGKLHDPLAKSHANRNEYVFFDDAGVMHKKPGGKIFIATRGGDYEDKQDVWVGSGHFGNFRKEPKKFKPEDLPEADRATVQDIVSTYRHEMGHILNRDFRSTKKTPYELASEIAAWQYAVEITPGHEVSERMVRKGLESHAYSAFRHQYWLNSTTVKSAPRYDQDDYANRLVQNEVKDGKVFPETVAEARAFTERVVKSLKNYGAALRKKGATRVPRVKDVWFQKRHENITPGPGAPDRL